MDQRKERKVVRYSLPYQHSSLITKPNYIFKPCRKYCRTSTAGQMEVIEEPAMMDHWAIQTR